ncbi:hypothetical protein DFH09DRAFT_1422624 [Mycena vulgaris]|nr:hypothetical protein DFH09DRAFT_1422624 [Mycena vulgaris]
MDDDRQCPSLTSPTDAHRRADTRRENAPQGRTARPHQRDDDIGIDSSATISATDVHHATTAQGRSSLSSSSRCLRTRPLGDTPAPPRLLRQRLATRALAPVSTSTPLRVASTTASDSSDTTSTSIDRARPYRHLGPSAPTPATSTRQRLRRRSPRAPHTPPRTGTRPARSASAHCVGPALPHTHRHSRQDSRAPPPTPPP